MKRTLKHFFETLMLMVLVGLLFVLPEDTASSCVNWIIFGLIVAVLIGISVYLYRGHRKGLFCFLLCVSLMMPHLALAAYDGDSDLDGDTSGTVSGGTTTGSGSTSSGGSYESYADQLLNFGHDMCESSAKFSWTDAFNPDKKIDEAIKAGKTAKDYEDDVKYTRQYLDLFEKARRAAGEKSLWEQFKLSLGVYTKDGRYMTAQSQCAEDFLKNFARFIKKKYETNMETVQALLKADSEYCWPCGIVHLVLQAVEKICIAIEDVMKTAALGLLGILTLFWILMKVLMLIGQFGTASNGAFFTEFLTRMFLVVIAAAILHFPMSWLYGQTLSPLIGMTAGLSQSFINYGNSKQGLTSTTAESTAMGSVLAGTGNLSCSCCESGSTSDCDKGTIELIEYPEKSLQDFDGENKDIDEVNEEMITNKGLLTVETKRQLLCLTCATYKQTAPMVASGRVLMYWSLNEKSSIREAVRGIASIFVPVLAVTPIPPSWWILGIILVFCFTWLAFSIAFRLIDIFLRIGFAFLLTPLLVTTFVFPITRQYTKRGWDFLVHAMLSMLALAMGISLLMSVFMSGLPKTVTDALTSLLQQESDPSNTYAKQLYEAFAGGGFYTVFYIFIMTFVGLNVIKASQVIIEGLSGLTSSIPSLSGAAVMAALHASLAPYRMAKSVTLDALTHAKGAGDKKSGDFDDALSKATPLGSFTETASGAAGEAMDKGGQAIEKGGAAAGKGMNAAGKGATAAGQGMMKAGSALSATGIGAVVGVPLMVVGGATTAAGYGAQAAGTAVEKGSKVAGQAAQKAGKATKEVGKKVGKGVKKAEETAGQGAKKTGNALKNRTQSAGLGEHAKSGSSQEQAQNKYGHKGKKPSTLQRAGLEAWDLADRTVDTGLSEGDKSFDTEHAPEPEPEEPKTDE